LADIHVVLTAKKREVDNCILADFCVVHISNSVMFVTNKGFSKIALQP
jgi:hypothetical protein